MFAAKAFAGQKLVPDEQVLDVLRAAPAPPVQAEDEWVGFAGIEVNGLHQAVRDALELAGDVERERLGRNVGFGLTFVLCGGGEGCKEEDDRGVDEMAHGGFCLYGDIDITSVITEPGR